ncbi:MAG: PEP-CTERM sorting domain-containing protein [Candidatus Acidiferrales bacterium]
MKALLKAILIFCFVLAASAGASADSLTLVNGGIDVMGGVYVGPYNFQGSLDGQTGSFQLICDDFTDDVYSGESWNIVESSFPGLTNAKFNPASSYEEVGRLAQQMFQNLSNSETVGEIQWAIWDIFDPNASSSDPYGTLTNSEENQIADWMDQATVNYASGNYSNLEVYTPVTGSQNPAGDGEPQEYIGLTPAPEPGAFLLVGIGLCFIGVLGRRFATGLQL